MGRNGYAEEGSLKISEEVIATIVDTAAADVHGVAGLSLKPIAGAPGRKRDVKAIRVETQNGEAVISLSVNLFMGSRIPDVAAELQQRVKDAVQTMTGITVSKVHVHIAGAVPAPQDPAMA